MHRSRVASSGWTLVEFAVAMAIFAVIMLVGMATWQMGWDGIRDEQNATLDYENAFSGLHTIVEQIQRSNSITIPDPDNTGVPSIQVLVSPLWNTSLGNPSYGNNVRRAYRLVGKNLIMEWKDEGDAVSTLSTDFTALTFTMLDAPVNSKVQITCSCTQGNRTVQMETVAWRRN
jgi:prepilin-type N-terminal cleavage/methylation domain-containing protein